MKVLMYMKILALIIIILTAQVAVAQTDEPSSSDERIKLETLVITANKRPQNVEKVDSSVSVITGEELEEQNIRDTKSLDRIEPSLHIRNRGTTIHNNFSIRGNYSPDFFNPNVTLFVDGVPQDGAFISQSLLNVDRVEVLKSPQGTLYGPQTVGGAINVITKKPGETWETSVEGTWGSIDKSGNIITGGALGSGFYLDLSVLQVQSDGQLDYEDDNKDNVDGSQSQTGRVRLHYNPKDDPLSIVVSYGTDQYTSDEEHYIRDEDIEDLKVYRADQFGDPNLERRVKTLGVTVDYEFGRFTLSSISSLQTREWDHSVFEDFLGNVEEEQSTMSQELRVATDGEGETLDGVFGIYYQKTDFKRKHKDTLLNAVRTDSTADLDTLSTAYFGEVTLHATSKLDLTAGARLSEEKAEVEYDVDSYTDFIGNNMPSVQASDSESFSNISPKASVGYQWEENFRTYALYSTGYKAGGYNRFIITGDEEAALKKRSYDPQTSRNVELGFKSHLLDKTLKLDASVYSIRTEDAQLYVGPFGSQALENTGTHLIQGMDIQIVGLINGNLELGLSNNTNNAKFLDYENEDTGEDFKDNKLPYSPDHTTKLSAKYFGDTPVGLIIPGITVNQIGKTYFNEANTLGQDAYTLVDAQLIWEQSETLKLTAFVENATDRTYRVYSFLSGPQKFSQIGKRRQVGVKVKTIF